MSQQEGDGYEHVHEYHDDESEDELADNVAAVKPLRSIWDCKHLCIKTREDEFGKLMSGWTCAYCPRSGNVGAYVFRKTVNATKALAHVLKFAGQDVAICRGIIPTAKKKAYRALYNLNQAKIQEKKARDDTLRGELHSFQDQSLDAHFPQAVSASCSQRKRAHEETHQGNLGRPPLLLVVSASELTKISMAMAVLRWERAHHWGGAH